MLGTCLYGCCGAFLPFLPLAMCHRAAPLRLAAILGRRRRCEWHPLVRLAIVDSSVPSVCAVVTHLAGDKPWNILGFCRTRTRAELLS